MLKILAIQNYECRSESRRRELRECMRHNLSIGFDLIYIFNDSLDPEYIDNNIVNIPLNRRFTYRDFLEIACLPDLDGALIVAANSDIKIDPFIFNVSAKLTDKMLLCFTRYESNNTLASNPWCTQDVWAIKGHNLHSSVMHSSSIPLGTPGCELRFAEIFYSAGYDVYNPSLSVKNIHLHSEENPHQDSARNFGAYLFTEPCILEQIGSYEVFTKLARLVYLNGRDSNILYGINLV